MMFLIILKFWENNRMEEIVFVTPYPRCAVESYLKWCYANVIL